MKRIDNSKHGIRRLSKQYLDLSRSNSNEEIQIRWDLKQPRVDSEQYHCLHSSHRGNQIRGPEASEANDVFVAYDQL